MSNRKYLRRSDVDKVADRPIVDHEVPEWGGWVRLRAMSAKQRSRVTGTFIAVDGADVKLRAAEIGNVQLLTVASCLIDEDDVPLYGPEELELLGEKNAGVVDRMFAALQDLSGLGKDAIDEAAENFAATPSAPSPSD